MASGLQSSGPISMSDIMVEWIEQENTNIHLTKYGDGESGLTPYPKNSGVQRKFSDYYGREYKVIREIDNPIAQVSKVDNEYTLDSLFQSYEKNARNRKRVVLNDPGYAIGSTGFSTQDERGILRWDLTSFNYEGEVEIRNYANIISPGGYAAEYNGGHAIRIATGGDTRYDFTINNYGHIWAGGGAGGAGGAGGEGQYLVGTTPTLQGRRAGAVASPGQGYINQAPYVSDPPVRNSGESALNNAGRGGFSGVGGLLGQIGTAGLAGEPGVISGGGDTALPSVSVVLGIGGYGEDGNVRYAGFDGQPTTVQVIGGGLSGTIEAGGGLAGSYKQTNRSPTGEVTINVTGTAIEHYVIATSDRNGFEGWGQASADSDVGGGAGGTVLAVMNSDPADSDGGSSNIFAITPSSNNPHLANISQVRAEMIELVSTYMPSLTSKTSNFASNWYGHDEEWTTKRGGQGADGGSTDYLGIKTGANGRNIGQGGGGAGYYGGHGGDGLWGGGGGGAASDGASNDDVERVGLIRGDDTYVMTATAVDLTNTESVYYQVTQAVNLGYTNPPDSSDALWLEMSIDDGATWETIDEILGSSNSPRDHWLYRRIVVPNKYRRPDVKIRYLNESSLSTETYALGSLYGVPKASSGSSTVGSASRLIDFDNASSYTVVMDSGGFSTLDLPAQFPEPDIPNLRQKYHGGRGGDGFIGMMGWDADNNVVYKHAFTLARPNSYWRETDPYFTQHTKVQTLAFPSGTTRGRIYVIGAGGGGGGCGHTDNNETASGGGAGGFVCYEFKTIINNVVGANIIPQAGLARGNAGRAVSWDVQPGAYSFVSNPGSSVKGYY